MSIWKKIKNNLADLYYWRTERKLTIEENERLRKMLECSESDRAELVASYELMQDQQKACIDALVKENEDLTKLLDGYVDELVHQRDINECLWRDWGEKHSEWAVATKKLQDKDDETYRLWAEHKLLLASMLLTDPEEGAKFYVE